MSIIYVLFSVQSSLRSSQHIILYFVFCILFVQLDLIHPPRAAVVGTLWVQSALRSSGGALICTIWSYLIIQSDHTTQLSLSHNPHRPGSHDHIKQLSDHPAQLIFAQSDHTTQLSLSLSHEGHHNLHRQATLRSCGHCDSSHLNNPISIPQLSISCIWPTVFFHSDGEYFSPPLMVKKAVEGKVRPSRWRPSAYPPRWSQD